MIRLTCNALIYAGCFYVDKEKWLWKSDSTFNYILGSVRFSACELSHFRYFSNETSTGDQKHTLTRDFHLLLKGENFPLWLFLISEKHTAQISVLQTVLLIKCSTVESYVTSTLFKDFQNFKSLGGFPPFEIETQIS